MSSKSSAGVKSEEVVFIRRRQGRSIATRQKILDAATAEFASSGFDGVTTRSIADRAKVPHGLVIYHFESKLGVWRAVTERAIHDFHDEFMQRLTELEGLDVVTQLKDLHRHFILMTAARPELVWLMGHEVGEESSRIEWLVEKFAGPAIDVTVKMISQAQRLGGFIEGDPAHLHFLFLGAATRLFLLPHEVERRLGASPFDKAFLNRHIKMCERLFFREPSGKLKKPKPKARSKPASRE